MIIEQLVLANAERAANTIVVLSPTDPTELRRSVNDVVPDHRRTRVVYRFGDPHVRADVALARVGEARGIIVLPEDDGDDVSVAQTVLALRAELGGVPEVPMVVEVTDSVTAERLVNACGPNIHPFVAAEAVARVGAFALRQRGLNRVVTELTDFHGCDLHVTERPELLGVRFDQIVGRFSNARPLGIAHPDGRFDLDPAADAVLGDGDRLVLIAHDLERIEVADTPLRLHRGQPMELDAAAFEEHILVLGWNPFGPHLISGWAAATPPSSSVEIVVDPQLIEPTSVVVADLDIDLRVSPTAESVIPEPERPPTTIVALGYTSIDSADADARTMLDVMHLQRRYAHADPAPRVVVQMLDDEHAHLAVLDGPDDIVISSALGSQLMAQLIEQPERRAVLLELYGGSTSIRMIRCDRLGLVGTVTLADIVTTAYAAGVLAIGWRHVIDGSVVLNAHIDTSVTLGDDDELVVVG